MMRVSVAWVMALALSAAVAPLSAATVLPTQVHLYVTGDPTEMSVSWVTQDNNMKTTVKWGTASNALTSSAEGTCDYFGTGGHDFSQHAAKMIGLKSQTRYFYVVGSSDGWSPVMNFTADPQREGGNIFAIYADFGLVNDVSLDQLLAEVDSESFDYVIHAGDFAYDLHTLNGVVGDWFLQDIAPISSRVPYMVSPGNHEAYENFTHYEHRFSAVVDGAGKNSESGTNLWYSYDIGNVHFISIDTELYTYSPSAAQQARQLKWLQEDLAKANMNRDKTPWIIAHGHKAWWMHNTNYTGFEDLFHAAGVDLYFCGHVHNYERDYPQYHGTVDKACASQPGYYINPKYMATTVVGSPGCPEHIDSEEGPARAVTSKTYGFGQLQVVNDTHAHWSWIQTQEAVGQDSTGHAKYAGVHKVLDELWFVQEQHGPRE